MLIADSAQKFLAPVADVYEEVSMWWLGK